MELHQVRYFLAVASTLNFTRAAEQCNVTQPALTKGVQKLEQELGGQLIYRERQLTQLTDLGKEVLPMLERTLASAEAVRRRAQEFQRKEVAPLKIGLAPSISVSLVLDPIAEIAKFVPGLHVELREGAAEKLVDLLLEGEINAAMVGDVQDIPARIDDWSLFEERYVAVLAPTHQLANRPSIGIDDLRETVLLERAGCDVAPKIQRSYFPEEPPQPRALQRSRLAPAAHGRGWLRRDTRARAHAAPSDAQDHSARRRPGFAGGAAAGCAGAPLLAGAGRFRQGRAASRLVGRSPLPGHAARNAPGGGERARMTTTRTPAANRFQPIDPQPDALPMPNQTDKTLAQIRTELLTTFSAADWESYSHLVGWLRDTDVASHALKVGDTAPDFLLPDADGRLHSSEQLRRNGPLVLSFFRGGCSADLGMKVLKALVGQLGASSGWRPTRPAGALASQWRGPAKRSAMQSIPDRYFAEAAACDSVGVIATT